MAANSGIISRLLNTVTDVDGQVVYLILQRVLGTPLEMAPAKARCSNGDRWYLVVPLI
jgi:hypothetical protein